MTRSDIKNLLAGITWRAKIEEKLMFVNVYVPKKRVIQVRTALLENMPVNIGFKVDELRNPLKMKKRDYIFSKDESL